MYCRSLDMLEKFVRFLNYCLFWGSASKTVQENVVLYHKPFSYWLHMDLVSNIWSKSFFQKLFVSRQLCLFFTYSPGQN